MTKNTNPPVKMIDLMKCAAIASQSVENASVSSHSWGQRKIRLSKSNLQRGDISLLAMSDFFNSAVVGSADSEAPQVLTAIWDGQSFETDIDGSQWTFRDRGTLVDYLFLFEATVGADLIIDRIADRVYIFRVSKAANAPAMPI